MTYCLLKLCKFTAVILGAYVIAVNMQDGLNLVNNTVFGTHTTQSRHADIDLPDSLDRLFSKEQMTKFDDSRLQDIFHGRG